MRHWGQEMICWLRVSTRPRRGLAAVAVGVLLATYASAAEQWGSFEELDLGLGLSRPLDDAELQAARGGFITNSGLEITFGIAQAIFLNDVPQAETTLRLNGPGESGSWTIPLGQSGTLIQNGPANVAPQDLMSTIANIVQNTMDQQKIGLRTTLDINVSNLQQFKAAAFHDMLRQQLVNSLR